MTSPYLDLPTRSLDEVLREREQMRNSSVELMRLSTGEVIARVEWECRQSWNYAASVHWWADPANAERAAEIKRKYVAAMPADPKLD